MDIKTKAKQLFCSHQHQILKYWCWCSQNELIAKYMCKDCDKEIKVRLKGKDATNFSTIMNKFEVDKHEANKYENTSDE